MKKSLFVFIVVFILLTFAACSSTTFDGIRTGNENQLIMEYKVLNKTDSQMLELQEGDSVDFVITSESGKLSIVLQKENREPICQDSDVPTSFFRAEIEETGTYMLSVTGENAKGSVNIIKIEND